MTDSEKLRLTHGGLGAPWGDHPKPADAIGSAGYIPGVARLGVPAMQETDAELGIGNPGDIRPGDVATAMPSNLALAASFDPALARRQGEAVGSEAKARGFNVLLGGAANLVREPRGGRDFEYFSEDPWLSGVMAGAQIAGAQARGVLTTLKHFALNDQETDRVVLDARIDRAAARESDLLAFELAIERGRPGAVMCAYNRVNGAYACENDWLMNTVLKGDWGFPGFVMSDWGAVHSSAAAANAGLDQESGEELDTENFFERPLADALAQGRLPHARLDDMAARIVGSMFALDLDRPGAPRAFDPDESDATALAVAREGAVLLKNQGALPLRPATVSVAAIGGHAERGVLSGGGSSQVAPRGGVALKAPTGPDGAALFDPSSPVDALRRRLPHATVAFDEGDDIARAALAASRAEVAIVFADQWKTETADAPDLTLPRRQDDLIEAVARANPLTVVVLETGGPVRLPWLDRVAAVLEVWYPGQRGGDAIADLVTGAADPSGRLPLTFPVSERQLPHPRLPGDPAGAPLGPAGRGGHYGRGFVADYDEGALVGYKWFAAKGLEPRFPLGYGLSYTRFALSHLVVSDAGGAVTASATVANVGNRSGVAVPEFYLEPGVTPLRLIGFERVALEPGESRRVAVAVDPRLLALFDEAGRRWRIAPGDYRVSVGFDAENRTARAELRLEPGELPP